MLYGILDNDRNLNNAWNHMYTVYT